MAVGWDQPLLVKAHLAEIPEERVKCQAPEQFPAPSERESEPVENPVKVNFLPRSAAAAALGHADQVPA